MRCNGGVVIYTIDQNFRENCRDRKISRFTVDVTFQQQLILNSKNLWIFVRGEFVKMYLVFGFFGSNTGNGRQHKLGEPNSKFSKLNEI